jgi:hypothetical protein
MRTLEEAWRVLGVELIKEPEHVPKDVTPLCNVAD